MNSELTKTRKLNKLLPVRTNTVGHWRFRGDLIDASPQGNDLTEVDAGTYTGYGWSEKITTVINLTGPTGPAAKIVAGSATDFDFGTGDFTVEVVLSISDDGVLYIIEKSDGGSPLTGFYIAISVGYLACKVGDGSNDVQAATSGQYTDGVWHHLAFVVDRANDVIRIYVDGSEVAGSPESISTVTGSVSAASDDLEFGKEFVGSIDELVVTPQVLTAGEIANRAAGVLEPYVPVVDGELLGYLPTMHHGNADLDELLIPFENLFAALRGKAFDVSDLIKFDQVPERHLPALAALFNFELPEDSTVIGLDARREMFRWITWLFQRKGTYACADKLIELAGLTAATIDKYPSSMPFTLNVHRTFGYGRAEQITFTEDFSGNMSQWDPPLNASLPWRIQNEALYNNVDSLVLTNYGILFDESDRSFYMEADIKMISALDSNFGFYLAYADANNWIRISKETAGGVWIVLRWSDGGSTGFALLSSNLTTLWSQFSNGDTIKMWVHADLDAKTYTVGFDSTTIVFQQTNAHPEITGTKKGLWQGAHAELEWDNVVVKDIRIELAATLPGDDYQDRTMKITYPGLSEESQRRKAYVAAVLPRYMPFGVMLEWIREVPVSSRIGFRTGSFIITKGWSMAGDKGARIGFRTGTATVIKGSLVRTPTPCRIGFRTRFDGVVRSPSSSSRIGFRTDGVTTIKQSLAVAGWHKSGDNDPVNEEMYISLPRLIDGDLDVDGGSDPTGNWSYGIEFETALQINTIFLFDSYTGESSGLYASTNNKLRVYYASSNEGPFSLQETFATLTRTERKITIALASTITAKVIKLHAYDDRLKSPDGTVLRPTEIEAYQT